MPTKSYPSSAVVGYEYNADGQLTKRTWSRGVFATCNYDAAGRSTGISYSDTVTPAVTASGSHADDLRYRFSTKPQDESGLYYCGYRYYQPELGRWISCDPIEEQGGYNLYNFVGDDGINGNDMLGLYLFAFDGTGNGKSSYTNIYLLYESYGEGRVGSYYSGVGIDEYTDPEGVASQIRQAFSRPDIIFVAADGAAIEIEFGYFAVRPLKDRIGNTTVCDG